MQYNLFDNKTLTKGHIINFEEDNSEINKEIKKEMDKLIQEGIDPGEINRISKYKLFLIYKTPEDLNDRLLELQNENLLF